jgi:hypothetical protein
MGHQDTRSIDWSNNNRLVQFFHQWWRVLEVGGSFHPRFHLLTFLSNWQWPQIEGLHSFQGSLLHSASWDNNVDLKGKSVAVIGNGSSGIQLVTALQPGTVH